jgi:hypothetical protein
MNLEQKILTVETDEIKTVKELIDVIKEIKEECTTENAINEIEYSIKHGILKIV